MSSEAKATFTLYTAPSPNGYKVSVTLGTTCLAAGSRAECSICLLQTLDFSILEQKQPWFLKINPNGRIPALTHHYLNGKMSHFNVFESSAILLYLVKHFDKERKISFLEGSEEESECLQWIFFIHGGIGPMQGQAIHFTRYAPEKIPYAINRYTNETKRLFTVLDDRLKEGEGRDYLVGSGRGRYSIADISAWTWYVLSIQYLNSETIESYPHFKGWLDRIGERPAVQLGLSVPLLPLQK
ncbi:glutathione S-transferase [Cantharellus anzutake]|uniref:glutathione S-transferase n=1 Tax=Cantharellus anzutake TaxID=1750568 RepID=UPI001904F5F4|nr:glutathione S-transferase [Cantharellus anzutake]KAF8320986.1 glutathione S-transferase [Cantharellus anzutake]